MPGKPSNPLGPGIPRYPRGPFGPAGPGVPFPPPGGPIQQHRKTKLNRWIRFHIAKHKCTGNEAQNINVQKKFEKYLLWNDKNRKKFIFAKLSKIIDN